MAPPGCPPCQPDPAAQPAASRRCYTTQWDTTGGDGKSGIVRDNTNIFGTGFSQRFTDTLTAYFPWDQRAEVESRIRALRAQDPAIRIHLVGHSYGGDTAAQIAAGMAGGPRPIDLLVTIDPVGRGTSSNFFDRVREGSHKWVNVNAAEGGTLERSNIITGLGGAWNYGPMGHADEFLIARVPHAAFPRMMQARLPDGRSIAPSRWTSASAFRAGT